MRSASRSRNTSTRSSYAGPRAAVRADGLVAGPGAVAAQLGRDRPRTAGGSAGLGHDQLHHVVEPAPFGVRGALPVGGVAAGQRGLGQPAHLVLVAELGERARRAARPSPRRRRRRGRGGGAGCGRAGCPTARRGRPARARRGASARRAARTGGPRAMSISAARTAARNRPGDEDRVVDHGAGVADPQLEGRRVRGRPDVEVGHLLVGDDPGADQVGEQRRRTPAPSAAGRWRRPWASAAR